MRIAFRTKGNHKQGMGDVIGSLAIADAFRAKGAEIMFIVDNDKEALRCIEKHGYTVALVQSEGEEVSNLISFRPDAIIVNQLNNPPQYLKNLKPHARLLATVDDAGEGAKVADLRFNPLYRAPDAFYGPEFAPLRKEFKKVDEKPRVRKRVKNILVTLGGSDTYGFTPKVVSALKDVPKEISITVLLGPAFKHEEELKKALRDADRAFMIARDVNARDMASLIAKADTVVCSGGNTLYEVARVGVPAIILCGEPFEEETAKRMEEKGFGVNLGFDRNIETKRISKAVNDIIADYKLRLRMSKKGKKLVDGKGAERIAEIVMEKTK